MEWNAVTAIASVLLMCAGGANYFILLQIKATLALELGKIRIEITNLKGDMKEWARAEFATSKDTDRRFAELWDAFEDLRRNCHGKRD